MTQTNQTTQAHLAALEIQQRRPDFKPRIGLVLGSGLGSLAAALDDPLVIPYDELPGFPALTVQGHLGQMILGFLAGVPVVCLQGRTHGYEGTDHSSVKTYVRTLRLLGCEYFLATNASGSLRADVGPGELMLITDHINFQATNPLIGPNDDQFGPRFYPLDQAYHPELCEHMIRCAHDESIALTPGVYIAVTGPHYETAAEINAFRILGADAVGMSTVPEVLVANHCGLKVAVIATITNYATGIARTSHSHEEVIRTASQASEKLKRLVKRFVATLPSNGG